LIKLFNFIATTSRFRELHAEEELGEILSIVGDPLAEIRPTTVSGLLVGRTHLDPISLPTLFGALLKNEPWRFRYLLRIIPIEKVVGLDINAIQEGIRDLSLKIGAAQSFRVTVEKRHNSLRSEEIIRRIASGISRRVKLSEPDWIVLVEVIQNLVGLSVIRPYHIFSTVVEMRKLGDNFIS
jgi:tRNA acetyltransferase TAN1